jgi:hypothetical protein
MSTSVFMPTVALDGLLGRPFRPLPRPPPGLSTSIDSHQDFTTTGIRLIDPESAWRRFQVLQKREAPTITVGGVVHRVVDFERYDDGLLSYTRETRDGIDTGAWRLFLHDRLDDPEPMMLNARHVREQLLQVYLDDALHARRDEITMPKISLLGDVPTPDGKIRQEFSLQDGKRFAILGCPPMKPRVVHRRSGETIKVGQFPIDGLLVYLKMIPQAALSLVDEFRLGQRYHPGKSGSALRLGGKFVVRLYPFERILKRSRDDMSEGETADQVLVRFFYSLCHEAVGHPMIFRNRFLRREMIKIVASGETPPSDYSKLGIEEWFSEGAAEFWRRYHLEGDVVAGAWRFEHPFLSGLILHLLGVLEEVVDPANENIGQWARTMRGRNGHRGRPKRAGRFSKNDRTPSLKSGNVDDQAIASRSASNCFSRDASALAFKSFFSLPKARRGEAANFSAMS